MTTTTEIEFLDMDAGERREYLAHELADWREVGFRSASWAKTFYRRVRMTARLVGLTDAAMLADLEADADAIAWGA